MDMYLIFYGAVLITVARRHASVHEHLSVSGYGCSNCCDSWIRSPVGVDLRLLGRGMCEHVWSRISSTWWVPMIKFGLNRIDGRYVNEDNVRGVCRY